MPCVSFPVEPLCLYLISLPEHQVLVEWINSTLKPEHIVVQTLEEDIYDGLVIHHLLGKTSVFILRETVITETLADVKHLISFFGLRKVRRSSPGGG